MEGAVDTGSTTGEAPDTVIVSASAPTFIATSIFATNAAVSTIPSRRIVWKPERENSTAKVPIGSGVSRYSPR